MISFSRVNLTAVAGILIDEPIKLLSPLPRAERIFNLSGSTFFAMSTTSDRRPTDRRNSESTERPRFIKLDTISLHAKANANFLTAFHSVLALCVLWREHLFAGIKYYAFIRRSVNFTNDGLSCAQSTDGPN